MTTIGTLLEVEPGAGGFSHQEMLKITGLTPETLFTWHKRNLMPAELFLRPGRGHRRKYNFLHVATLAGAKVLTDSGLPVRDAILLGLSELGLRVFHMLSRHADLTPIEAVEKLKTEEIPWVAIVQGAKPAGERVGELTYGHGGTVSTDRYTCKPLHSQDTAEEIREWIRRNHLISITLVDVVALAVRLLSRALNALESRT